MKTFITRASGGIGTAVTAELLKAGHDVVGLARSDESAAHVVAAGATCSAVISTTPPVSPKQPMFPVV